MYINKLFRFVTLSIILASTLSAQSVKERRKVADHLQNVSVTIKSNNGYRSSEGSGVLIVREIGDEEVTFVWTAAHTICPHLS